MLCWTLCWTKIWRVQARGMVVPVCDGNPFAWTWKGVYFAIAVLIYPYTLHYPRWLRNLPVRTMVPRFVQILVNMLKPRVLSPKWEAF